MKQTITYYKWDGTMYEERELTPCNIKSGLLGMKVRCVMSDQSERVGFANPYYSFEEDKMVVGDKADRLDYLALETFIHLDEETHTLVGDGVEKYDIAYERVYLSDIIHIDAILYSGLRWGAPVTNRFYFKKK